MTATTPAALLRAAADKLRSSIARVPDNMLTQPGWDHAACHGDDLIPAEIMHPGIAASLADILEYAADAREASIAAAGFVWGDTARPEAQEFIEDEAGSESYALVLAHRILGGVE